MNAFWWQVAILIYCLRSEGYFISVPWSWSMPYNYVYCWFQEDSSLCFPSGLMAHWRWPIIGLSMFTEMLNNHRPSSVGPRDNKHFVENSRFCDTDLACFLVCGYEFGNDLTCNPGSKQSSFRSFFWLAQKQLTLVWTLLYHAF